MNILTFDIEEWYLEKVLHNGGRKDKLHLYDDAFDRLIDDLERCNVKATFFCLGKLAVERPDVIKKISDNGHEVGCHSNEHAWLTKMDEKTLKQDTLDAIKALEDVSGQRVTSYRAPAFSITPDNKWVVSVLAECGIETDSSIFPIARDFGGYPSFHKDSPCLINYAGATLKEYPISIAKILGKTMAYSGGGYYRILPYWMVKNTVSKQAYNIFYFHLNDLISQKIKMKNKKEHEEYYNEPGTLKNRLMRYAKSNVGNGDGYGKLLKLMNDFQLTSIKDCGFDWSKTETITL